MIRFGATPYIVCTLAGLGLASLCRAQTKKAPTPPTPKGVGSARPAQKPAQASGPIETQIGDVKISRPSAIHSRLGIETTISGPNTLITVPDKRNHTTLRLHADTIEIRQDKGNIAGMIDLTGHVRYTIIRTPPGEKRQTVEGTAGHGLYRRATQRIALTEGVHTTLTDPAHLSGPGTLRAGSVSVDMSATPYVYTVEGDPDTNDIQFSPLPPASEKAAPHTVRIRDVHVFGFRDGTFQMGEHAQFRGAETTLEASDPAEKAQARLKAEQAEAVFGGQPSTLQRAEATGNVRYTIERPNPSGSGVQTIEGHCGRAIYEPQKDLLELTEGVQALVTSPDVLEGPARVSADRVVAHITPPYRYEISGAPQHTRLEFAPRPRATTPQAAGAKPAAKFGVGTIVIAAFDRGTFAPGKEIVFDGGDTTFDTADKQAGTTAHLQAGHVVATYAADGTISRADATGNVHYHLERPAPDGKSRQMVRGTAARLALINTPDSRQIEVYGPMHAEVTDPEHLVGPGRIDGAEGDSLRLNLAASLNEFDIDSPRQTATIQFVPRETSQESAPSPPTPPAPAKKADKRDKPGKG